MKKETKERTNMSTDDYSPDNPPYWVRHTPKPGIIGLDMDFIRGIAAEAEQKEAWRRREAQRQGSEAPSQESEALRLQLEAIAQKLLDEQARLLELGASTTEPPLPPKPSQSDDA